MDFKHMPVLFEECMRGLNLHAGSVCVDGTVGGGGHACGIAERIGKEGILIGIDRDEEALRAAGARLDNPMELGDSKTDMK